MGKSRLREEVEDIPKEKRKLHRSLTKISMNVSKGLRESDLSKEGLEKEIDRHDDENPGEYVNRLLGGGINLSLRTIFKLEEALDIELIDTREHDSEDAGRRRRR